MRSLIRFALVGFLAAAPAIVRAQREKFTPDELDYLEKTWPNAKKTNTGMRYLVEQPGTGDIARPGNMVSVLYIGRLMLTGKEFDRDQNPKHPFTFRLGRGNVIPGWDQVLQLMRMGEKRLVIIPSELAYGTHGSPPQIPPDTSLIFEIELIGIKKDS